MIELKGFTTLIEQKKYKEVLSSLAEIDYLKLTLSEILEIYSFTKSIPKEYRYKSATHIVDSAHACKMVGDLAEFEELYRALVALRDESRDNSNEKEKLEHCISRVNLMRSKTNNAQTLILLCAMIDKAGKNYNILPCTATSKKPSVLRGTMDCSEWGKYYKAVKSILLPILEKLGDFDGRCAVELAIGELCMEKGDFNGALLSLGIAVTSQDPEIRCGAYYALAKLYLFEGDKEKAQATINTAKQFVDDTGAHWLRDNINATLADIAIYNGEMEFVEKWMSDMEWVVNEKVLPDTEFIKLIYAKALLSKGEWREATMLLQNLSEYFEDNSRPLESIDCKVLCAISLMQLDSDDKAIELLHTAICEAKPYGYTNIFAEKGKLMFRLLGKYQKSYQPENGQSKFINAISAQTKKASLALASEFGCNEASDSDTNETPSLTDTEVRILQMLNEGVSNKVIGIDLDIKLTTVKFHVKNLFTKFNVQNRVELLNRARALKLIS